MRNRRVCSFGVRGAEEWFLPLDVFFYLVIVREFISLPI